MNMSSLSTEYIGPPITATQNGDAFNPSATTVQLAFMAPGTDPQSGDWHTGSWETLLKGLTLPNGQHIPGPVYRARCLVGPAGGVALATGSYEVWVKISAPPETPVKATGMLEVQ